MKKGLLVILMAICFASLSFAGVKIKPKVSHRTEIYNMVEKVSVLNDLKNPDLIYPGQTILFPLPWQNGNLGIDALPGDCLSMMCSKFISGPVIHYIPENGSSVLKIAPVSAPAPFIIKVDYLDSTLLGLLIFCLIILLIWFIFKRIESIKRREEDKKMIARIEEQNSQLARELQSTKNKLPILATPVVNSDWLKSNNPVGEDITNSSAFVAQMMVAKVYGKKPGLIAQALVSTSKNAISMLFSHQRIAKTGLDGVPVYLAWNWDTEKSKWAEVGMIATVCSNGFQVSPEKVVPMDKLFTKFELVSLDKHPVILCDGGAPEGTIYPELVSRLVVKYHENDIKDLRKAGATVEIPKQEKK